MVTRDRFQLLKVLSWRQGDGLLLFVDLERAGTKVSRRVNCSPGRPAGSRSSTGCRTPSRPPVT
jgi:hypothetical protein